MYNDHNLTKRRHIMKALDKIYSDLGEQEYSLIVEYNDVMAQIEEQKILNDGNYDLNLLANSVALEKAISHVKDAQKELRKLVDIK